MRPATAAEATACEIDGCERPQRSRTAKWCNTHYFRWYRHGDPLTPGRAEARERTCSIEGCSKPHHAKGWCHMHHVRWQRHGDPTIATTRPEPTGWITADGYRAVSAVGHPLASVDDRAYEHRLVLYSAIGPGEHPCHWCGKTVSWDKSWPQNPDALVVDHLNGDKLDNDISNLVPSCQPCNYSRR